MKRVAGAMERNSSSKADASWVYRPAFRRRPDGYWDYFPSIWSRLGYRVDSATKSRLPWEPSLRSFLWLGGAAASVGLVLSAWTFLGFGNRFVAELMPAFSPCFDLESTRVSIGLIAFWFGARLFKAMERWNAARILADKTPATVSLSPREHRQRIFEQAYFGHPVLWASTGTLLFSMNLSGMISKFTRGDLAGEVDGLLFGLFGFLYFGRSALRAWWYVLCDTRARRKSISAHQNLGTADH